jgi:hypothetical protein
MDAARRLDRFLYLLTELEAAVEQCGIVWPEGLGIDVGRRLLRLAAQVGIDATAVAKRDA